MFNVDFGAIDFMGFFRGSDKEMLAELVGWEAINRASSSECLLLYGDLFTP